MHPSHLITSVWKRYSLLRAYENEFVRNLRLSGLGIDLGAKSKDAKYYEYMDLGGVQRLDFVDLFSDGDGIVKMDLEQPFPIADATYDFVLSFNVMEHIFNYRNLIAESRRILRDGGELHGFVPLMHHFHPDPNDYFRFTGQALERILGEEGFTGVEVMPIAYGPFKVAAAAMGHVVRYRLFRVVAYGIGMALDRFVENFSSGGKNYAMAYYFHGKRKG
jgi:SAM-dependent methyltransferase